MPLHPGTSRKIAGLFFGLMLSMAAGCSLSLGESPFLCNSGEPECPVDYECKHGRCVKKGHCPSSIPQCKAINEAGLPPGDAGSREGGKPPPGKDLKIGPGKDLNKPPPGDTDPWPPDRPPLPPDMPPPPPDMPMTTTGTFGDTCGAGYPGCKPGLKCMSLPGQTASFCTKTCPSIGQTCTGTPGSTHAKCVLPDATKQLHCAFICAYNTQKWPCPSNMTCAKLPNPPTSLQYPCEP